MATPKNEVLQMEIQNPDAENKLFIPVLVICNTPDEELKNNIRINSAKDLRWLKAEKPHDGVAIMVGGGSSINSHIFNIRNLKKEGGTVFAMNAASKWCNEHDIDVDYQCILDAKEETSTLVDEEAEQYLFGSQVHPKTMDSVEDPIVWHLEIGDIEDEFPEDRRKRGGYALLGGGAAVGNSALCAAYAMGYREIHVFGYDSCHTNGKSHAYRQDMNKAIPSVEVKWGDEIYTASVAMKTQAEKFQLTSQALIKEGCDIKVYGDGLLQAMYRTKFEDLTEQQKYQRMWQFDRYREISPGEHAVGLYKTLFEPEGMIIDFGCGTGRAGVKFRELGHDVFLVDFADNCRDDEALSLPFLQWDLTNPCPMKAENGFCTDVMEHIPTKDVQKVIHNIMGSADKVFFQISTIDDHLGEMIDEPLHLTVEPHGWWLHLFETLGYEVQWSEEHEILSLFYVINPDRR